MLANLINKHKKLCVGLMSGTSLDGIDAVLVEIQGFGINTKVKQLEFISVPYSSEIRNRILQIAEGKFGGSNELCLMNFFLGELFSDTVKSLCKVAGISPYDIDLIGSHGQTVWHSPIKINYFGKSISSTMQIGEPSILCELCNSVVVSDFRVRDMSSAGLGAPLVPYTEYLLYRSTEKTIALQNIGGIGNITILPKGCGLEDVVAFDTGPGNMIIDELTFRMTNGEKTYDDEGKLAENGSPDDELIKLLLKDEYFLKPPPKTTGREIYGSDYISNLISLSKKRNLSMYDTIATATKFTAETIKLAVKNFSNEKIDQLIVGGGGTLNPTLMHYLRECIPETSVLTNEQIGFDSNSKEAVAFAILANEAIHSSSNNICNVTGASHPVVMGKISQ